MRRGVGAFVIVVLALLAFASVPAQASVGAQFGIQDDACNNSVSQAQTITWRIDTLTISPQPFTDCTGSTTNNLGCNPDPSSIPACLPIPGPIHAVSSCGNGVLTCQLTQTTNQLTCVRTRVV